ncbi:MAG: hypothetical protein LC689_10240 [Myxococcales bacterium]|nr:hypothetical protein [Myxococcales bacterium]
MVALALAGCGLENFFSNETHNDFARPASAISGSATFNGADKAVYAAVDSDGNAIAPFQTLYDSKTSTYEMRLPSSKYGWIIAQARSGNMLLSDIVPEIGEETRLENVNFDARSATETLIVVARLSADGLKMKTLTPAVYQGTRAVIQASMNVPGPSQDLLHMVERVIAKGDKDLIGGDPGFFFLPVYDGNFKVKTGAIDPSFIARHPVDLDGDGIDDVLTTKFDTKLGDAAKAAPSPAGCPDPTMVRLVFTVDFNSGGKDGNCNTVDKFKWATDKPGKRMFFVGWIHTESEVQDPGINSLLGASTPNTIPMYDDGTNGDEVAGDNVWTVYFDVPRRTAGRLRVGYKYTWGLRGQVWTGSEEWPGNSRILEVVDDNRDNLVYRHDVWGDEATNKDRSNLNLNGNGSITWTTDLHGCGTPESHENGWDDNSCKCKPVLTPKAVGPINRACTGP